MLTPALRLRGAALLCIALVLLLAACSGDPAPSGPSSGAGGATTSSTTTTTYTWWSSTIYTSVCGEGALTADAGATQTVDSGSEVQLQGSASSPRCEAVLSFFWEQIGGETVALDDPTSPTPVFQAPATHQTLGFRLEVTDDEGAMTAAFTSVIVGFAAPVAHAGPDVGGLDGAFVTLAGSGVDPLDLPLTFTWTQVSGPPVPLDSAAMDTPTLVIPKGLAEPLVYALVVDNGHVPSEPDWVTVRRLNGPDTDGDLLEDDVEATLGTDPEDPDTDHDGIPDGWEVLGHEGVDYAALGCDPLHRDLLVELAVQEYTANGVLHSARPTAGVLSALVDFYAALPLASPDGTTGVDLHLVDGAVLDESFVCLNGAGEFCDLFDAPGDFLHRESFHRASFCLGAILQGCGDIGGHRLGLQIPELDTDPTNDDVEPAAFDVYRIFIHEMGHNLGLQHGGDSGLNYKPNYPSIMNYAYDRREPGGTIAGGGVLFSRGALPAVDECVIVEQGVFAGVPAADTAVLATYQGDQGWTVGADGSVDWNRDGVVTSAPYELVIRAQVGFSSNCSLLTDFDDHAAIDDGLGASLPASPSAGALMPRKAARPEVRTVP